MLEVIIILLLILANGIFALSEMSLVSSRRVRLEQLADEGNRQASTALELMRQPNRFLSTVQIGITLIGVLAGAFGGSALAKPVAAFLSRVPLLEPYSQTISFILVVIIITYFSLVLGELVPKRIALSNPERFATATAGLMSAVSRIARPFVSLLSNSTNLILRLVGIRPDTIKAISNEEVLMLLEEATEAGVVETAEQDIAENVFLLGDRRVNQLMTPRREIDWLDMSKDNSSLKAFILEKPHSRYIVSDGELDKVLGVVLSRDVLANLLSEQPLDLKNLLQTPLFVPESMTALKLLEAFQKSSTHSALVVDEYGSVEGLVTLHDLLVSLLGNIPDLDEDEEEALVKQEKDSWLLDGQMAIEDLLELINISELPEGATREYVTLGGFVLAELGHIPVVGERFDWQGYSFKIRVMDGNRIAQVKVRRKQASEASTEATEKKNGA